MVENQSSILVVDDEESICQLLEIMLSEQGYAVRTAKDYDAAMKCIQSESFDLVIADIMMPGKDGLALLSDIKKLDVDLPVILITAYASLPSAVEALRLKAFDYITKPFQIDHINFVVRRAIESRTLRKENRLLRHAVRGRAELDKFVGNSKATKKIKELVRRIAPTDGTVLITGESGTGKEVIARAIHSLSDRAEGPFVSINCAALPETLLESELFGYVKGAFTGANRDKDGLLKTATNGTFLLDEVGEMSLSIQAKLLRVLETGELTPLGATKPVRVDVRLIAATNQDLKLMVEKKLFRQDLFYRLDVLHIHIPPLRERREDILPIAAEIIKDIAARRDEKPKKISHEVEEILLKMNWEGNVREMENVLERAVLLCDGDTILPQHLPAYFKEQMPPAAIQPKSEEGVAFGNIVPLEEIEKAYIYWVLVRTHFNKSEAARLLGIDLSTLYRKIEKYSLKELIPD